VKNRFERLLSPKSIAVFGGQWAASVISQCRKLGYQGEIWPVHPSHSTIDGLVCFESVDDLPAPPDACFLAVNNESTIDIVAKLSSTGAGGAVCFAAGFSETASRDTQGESRQARLIDVAGDMPLLGPNCYGLINYVDRVAPWPDQHGGRPPTSGVAIITQSSNTALNLTMQQRGLPVSYFSTAGHHVHPTPAEPPLAIL